jgi:dCMP deaminase
MLMAHVAALRGTCNRLQVGAVLTLDSRPISIGYNGAPANQPHCGSDCNHQNPCKNTLHAEHNALNWAEKHLGLVPIGCTLYITDSPCIDCAIMIRRHNVKKVVYDRAYRVKDGLEYLTRQGVEVVQCHASLAISAN